MNDYEYKKQKRYYIYITIINISLLNKKEKFYLIYKKIQITLKNRNVSYKHKKLTGIYQIQFIQIFF